ncbi:MAG TPA: YjbQ family protein [Firmicutes bacterium]|jgi:secondary thiamine-phosphate synthase enzyme|nr:YjbQ family protein [Bacillota bacterium]
MLPGIPWGCLGYFHRQKGDGIVRQELQTTKPQQFIDITNRVAAEVQQSKVEDGIAVIFVPHTTAAVTINEHADPDVGRDIIFALDKTIPEQGAYLHREGNAHAHIKASLMGSSCTVIIRSGRILLGTWQGIFFCEFDGPRKREFYVKILGG